MKKSRLNKFLAEAGLASRRKVEKWIIAGRVKINGQLVKDPGFKVSTEDKVEVDGRIITPEPKVYFLFYKPVGYLTTLFDPHGRPTIKPFLKEIPYRVFPVGRLDFNTEGLLLLTNDGELANRLSHPRYGIIRTYHATVKGHPKDTKLRRLLQEGIEVEGKHVWPKAIKILGHTSQDSTFEIVIKEGRKREVRKIFAAIGHRVIKLKRVKFGPLSLSNLKLGEIRPLSQKELRLLKKTCGLL